MPGDSWQSALLQFTFFLVMCGGASYFTRSKDRPSG